MTEESLSDLFVEQESLEVSPHAARIASASSNLRNYDPCNNATQPSRILLILRLDGGFPSTSSPYQYAPQKEKTCR